MDLSIKIFVISSSSLSQQQRYLISIWNAIVINLHTEEIFKIIISQPKFLHTEKKNSLSTSLNTLLNIRLCWTTLNSMQKMPGGLLPVAQSTLSSREKSPSTRWANDDEKNIQKSISQTKNVNRERNNRAWLKLRANWHYKFSQPLSHLFKSLLRISANDPASQINLKEF